MRAVGAVLERLLTAGAVPACQRCGERMIVVSEERLATVVPVFQILCRCSGCGLASTVRQVFDLFD
jgi:hypothetical protein